MANGTVLVFGAGATKACGGPGADEILPQAFEPYQSDLYSERGGFLKLVNDFLIEYHHVPSKIEDRKDEDYPQLSFLFALLQTAIDTGESIGENWPLERLKDVRAALDFLIFALLQYKLQTLTYNYYWDILKVVQNRGMLEPDVITPNYDIIIDNSMCMLSRSGYLDSNDIAFPDYGTQIETKAYKNRSRRFGRLSKLHGSLHWIYCTGCKQLRLGMDESGTVFTKVLHILWENLGPLYEELYHEDNLGKYYLNRGRRCESCGAEVGPVLITPTYERDYEKPCIQDAWEQARDMLANADSAIIVGYSLPQEDKDVNLLLWKGLKHVSPERITVIDYDQDFRPRSDNPKDHLRQHAVGRRYRNLFGDQLDWHPEGVQAWLNPL